MKKGDAYSTWFADQLMKPAPPITRQDLFELYTSGLISEKHYQTSLKEIDEQEKNNKTVGGQ